jgi:mono/diheme cytochrome c family protein
VAPPFPCKAASDTQGRQHPFTTFLSPPCNLRLGTVKPAMNFGRDGLACRRGAPDNAAWRPNMRPDFGASKGSMLSQALLPLALLIWACAGCDRPPSAESLKVWAPNDHHSADDNRLASGAQAAQAPNAAGKGDDVPQLVDITWRQQCSACHGAGGHGDGQMGAMLNVPDLTNGDWQAKVTDAEIGSTIMAGKNKMPKFDLPPQVLGGLVSRIRGLRGK